MIQTGVTGFESNNFTNNTTTNSTILLIPGNYQFTNPQLNNPTIFDKNTIEKAEYLMAGHESVEDAIADIHIKIDKPDDPDASQKILERSKRDVILERVDNMEILLDSTDILLEREIKHREERSANQQVTVTKVKYSPEMLYHIPSANVDSPTLQHIFSIMNRYSSDCKTVEQIKSSAASMVITLSPNSWLYPLLNDKDIPLLFLDLRGSHVQKTEILKDLQRIDYKNAISFNGAIEDIWTGRPGCKIVWRVDQLEDMIEAQRALKIINVKYSDFHYLQTVLHREEIAPLIEGGSFMPYSLKEVNGEFIFSYIPRTTTTTATSAETALTTTPAATSAETALTTTTPAAASAETAFTTTPAAAAGEMALALEQKEIERVVRENRDVFIKYWIGGISGVLGTIMGAIGVCAVVKIKNSFNNKENNNFSDHDSISWPGEGELGGLVDEAELGGLVDEAELGELVVEPELGELVAEAELGGLVVEVESVQ